MKSFTKFDEAKEIIRKGIKDGISFAELRNQLPDWRKRPLQSLIFDVGSADIGVNRNFLQAVDILEIK